MGLTKEDIQQLRVIVREELESSITIRVDPRFDSLGRRIEALNYDIKEICAMISEFQKLTRQVAHFEKYDLEQKILSSYKNIISITKEAGITLPRT